MCTFLKDPELDDLLKNNIKVETLNKINDSPVINFLFYLPLE